jgi:hypothetical protein
MLCKTDSTCCSEVTVTAKESSGSAVSDLAGPVVDPTKPPADWQEISGKEGIYTIVV